MKTLDYLHLDENKVVNTVNALGLLLADFQVFYANLRGLHWNVQGKGFFSLHEKYEELYNDVATKVDEIAERILQLGGRPENRYSEYLKVAHLQEDGFEPTGRHGMQKVLDTLSLLIKAEREVLAVANEAGDDVTVALMGDYLRSQEKTVWMLVSFLNQCPSCHK